MNYQHKYLAQGRWNELTLCEQFANIGSEVERTISWREKNHEFSQKAFVRCLDLIDLTYKDQKNKFRLREISRVREALVDYFFGENQYQSSDSLWQKYFFSFTYKARKNN